MRKIAASVLLKLFVNSIERCHTTDDPLAHERNSIAKCKQIQPKMHEESKILHNKTHNTSVYQCSSMSLPTLVIYSKSESLPGSVRQWCHITHPSMLCWRVHPNESKFGVGWGAYCFKLIQSNIPIRESVFISI